VTDTVATPPPSEVRSSGGESNPAPPFFPTSIAKFVTLSICSFGIYELYWMYKNWQLIRIRDNLDISPFGRAFFGFFYCYQLFKAVRDPGI
jgi:hypothetical protein